MSEGDVVDEGGDVDGDGEESADLRVGAVGMGIGHLHLLCWLGVRGASAVAVADTDDDRRNGAAMAWNLPAVETLDELDLVRNVLRQAFGGRQFGMVAAGNNFGHRLNLQCVK